MSKNNNHWSGRFSRRDFNKLTALGAACGALLPLSISFGAEAKEVVGLSGIQKGADLKQAVKDAVLAVDNLDWLSKGNSVLIKPVLNSGIKFPATTSPMAVAAMVELLKDRGADRVVITDMSGIEHVKLSEDKLRGSSRSLMESSGIAAAAQEAGAELYFPEEDGWSAFHEEEPAHGRSWKNPVTMPNIVNEVDHIVLMPRCSRHLLAGSSLGMKAAVGWWRTDTRLEYHRDASTFQEKTAEANTVPVTYGEAKTRGNGGGQDHGDLRSRPGICGRARDRSCNRLPFIACSRHDQPGMDDRKPKERTKE